MKSSLRNHVATTNSYQQFDSKIHVQFISTPEQPQTARNDSKAPTVKAAFQNMEDQEFTSKFRKELTRFGKQIVEWEKSVKIYLETQFRDMKQMLGNDMAISLEKVYVELTMLKQKPRSVKLGDGTTYN